MVCELSDDERNLVYFAMAAGLSKINLRSSEKDNNNSTLANGSVRYVNG